MLVNIIAAFLGLALLLYCLFAGADFGAGMIEAFVSERGEEEGVITHALGPVWEANHVWLVLAVVILFMGFPRVYVAASITYHIPLTLMLIGVILRGCAFTFRHYDAVQGKSHHYYTLIFIISSFLTPLMLGTVAGSILYGHVRGFELSAQPTFADLYVWPWCNLFSFSVGIFTCVLFMFLAAVYLLGEVRDAKLKLRFERRAKIVNLAALITGLLVFICAEIDHVALTSWFFADLLSIAAMIGATFLLVPLWLSVRHQRLGWARVFVAAQVLCVLVGWVSLQYPVLIRTGSDPITIHNAGAGEATLWALLYALIAGSLVIFPALIYLLKSFKAPHGTSP